MIHHHCGRCCNLDLNYCNQRDLIRHYSVPTLPQLITSQRGNAWQCYIGRWLSVGKHAFFHLSARKTLGNFRTKFGISNEHVGKTNKHTKVGSDRFTGRAATQWLCAFCSPFYIFFSVSSSRLQVAILDRFARFMAQTTCSVLYKWLFRVWSLQTLIQGVFSPKTPKFRPVFGLRRFATEIASALEPSGVNYP